MGIAQRQVAQDLNVGWNQSYCSYVNGNAYVTVLYTVQTIYSLSLYHIVYRSRCISNLLDAIFSLFSFTSLALDCFLLVSYFIYSTLSHIAYRYTYTVTVY